jgi:UTP:GlnB (protein PII) uridylyltransferase
LPGKLPRPAPPLAALDALLAGDEVAHSLGVAPQRLRQQVLLARHRRHASHELAAQRAQQRRHLGPRQPLRQRRLRALPAIPMSKRVGAYYLRLMVLDRPGVIADVTAALRDHQISLESMLQRGRSPGEAVPVVVTTHDCEEAQMRAALARIEALGTVVEKPALIRIENLA